jgi:hypothetical protein
MEALSWIRNSLPDNLTGARAGLLARPGNFKGIFPHL